jgi:monovalent cation:H+ antiporter, CPA1 family
MTQFLATETLVIELLLVVSLVAIAVRRLRVPYTVALVVVGLLITFQQELRIDLTSELILALFVPPLVFEAAFHLRLARLWENLVPLLVLTIPGVILSTLLVGGMVAAGVGIPLSTALVFGALISATDPVAVVSMFRVLGAPKRLAVLVEGESLLNDGTAIVVYNLVIVGAIGSLAGGASQTEPVSLLLAAADFVRVAAGGAAIGFAFGWLASEVIDRVDDYLIETTVTTIVAFGSYLAAERLHISGVLAVVAAGLVVGNVSPRGMSPTTRIVLFNFWEYLAFVANSLVFLLLGLQVNIPDVVAELGPIAVAVAAVLASRAIVVYSLAALLRLLRLQSVPLAYQHVLFWGGLRGAIALALALSLPLDLPDRDLLRVMAFGVVLFTLLVQGTTMQLLLRRLGFAQREPSVLEFERRHALAIATRSARDHLGQLHRDGLVSATTYEELSTDLDAQIRARAEAQSELLRENPLLRVAERERAMRETLRAKRGAISALLGDGVISEQVHDELVADVDAALAGDEPLETE